MKLTDRQIKVLALLAQGHKNKQVADRAALGITTLENDLLAARQNNGCLGTMQLVYKAAKAGVI